MLTPIEKHKSPHYLGQSGSSLIELLVALSLFMSISASLYAALQVVTKSLSLPLPHIVLRCAAPACSKDISTNKTQCSCNESDAVASIYTP